METENELGHDRVDPEIDWITTRFLGDFLTLRVIFSVSGNPDTTKTGLCNIEERRLSLWK